MEITARAQSSTARAMHPEGSFTLGFELVAELLKCFVATYGRHGTATLSLRRQHTNSNGDTKFTCLAYE